MIRIFKTEDGAMHEKEEMQPGCWIALTNPTASEILEIADACQIDPDHLKAPLDEEERSRIEAEDEYTLILVDIPSIEERNGKDWFVTIPMAIITTKDVLITVCLEETPILTAFMDGRVRDFHTFMKTRFIYVLLAVLLMGSQTISAQNKDNKDNKQRPTPEQMMQRQTNLMVKTLMLDDATAAKFTPVYENYLKELRECRMMNRKDRMRNNNAEAKQTPKPVPTDAEIEKQIKDQFAQSRKILDVREKYYNEFRKILAPKQIMKIYQTEKNNANKFRKEFDRRKGQKHGQGKRPVAGRPAPNSK